LKEVRYVPQLTKNFISVGRLEAQVLRRTLQEGILKMSSGSLVLLKDIQRNNLYYLKGYAVTEKLLASKYLKDNSTRLWLMRLGRVALYSLQVLAK